MLTVLTPVEMGRCDAATIAAGTPEATLIERAASAVMMSAVSLMAGVYGRRVVVAAGPGNNGNDGRVAARLLTGRGCDVHVVAVGRDEQPLATADLVELDQADLLIDAMYGTGFRGRLEGVAAQVAAEASRAARVLAIDIPSGVNGLTGQTSGSAVIADRTVTFAAHKPGLVLEPGRSYAGELELADIGVDLGAADATALQMLEPVDVAALVPPRHPLDHKWTAAVMVVGGSRGMIGAPALAARAAQRAGAGMVVCGVPGPDAAARVSGEETVARTLRATEHGALADDAAGPVLRELDRFGALVLGPGIGRDAPAFAAIGQLVAEAPTSLVVDADGLHAIGSDPVVLRVRTAAGLPAAVLTPHAGEFEVLAGRPVGDDRVHAARELAAELSAVVLLKGAGTVVADPTGRAVVTPTGGPQLATAGTGDVLSGMIGALLARGLEPFEAAAAGAWWHGRAGDSLGPGAVASDVIEALGRTLDAVRTDGG